MHEHNDDLDREARDTVSGVFAWVPVSGSLRQKLGSEFTFSVSPFYSYDCRPPSAAAAREDWGWTSSLGWGF